MITLLSLLLSGLALAKPSYIPRESDRPSDAPVRSPSGVPAAPDGLVLVELDSEEIGGRRSAYVFVPQVSGPKPVILAFHGGRNNNGLEMAPRLESAEEEGVLLVFPNGTRTGTKNSGWTGPDHENDVDPMRDVLFVRALLDELDERYGIDRKKVYAAGFSGGAYMAQWLWCQASDEIHGFFIVSRAMPVVMAQQCPANPPRPVALMMGTADDGLVNRHQMSFSDTLGFVTDRLECRGEPETDTLPDKNDNTTVNHSEWDDCARGASFEYWEIVGGGHAWPGHGRPEADKSRDVDATAEMVRFFRQNGGL